MEAMETTDEDSVSLGLALDLQNELWEKRDAIKVSGTREFGGKVFCEALIASTNKGS